ncbi:MAG: response regulator [Elusimicrobia bacterium]|nr:response regulator [Elusimicrobiota bacterium]
MNNRILVVDDDPADRKILACLFETTGEVIEASTGEEALRIIEAERPRLMMLDMVMPGMSGLEVLQACQASAVTMTIIVLTSQNDIELAKRALELGAVEYITKPFVLANLKEKVERCVKVVPEDKGKDDGRPWRIVGQIDAPPKK